MFPVLISDKKLLPEIPKKRLPQSCIDPASRAYNARMQEIASGDFTDCDEMWKMWQSASDIEFVEIDLEIQ